MTSRDQRYKKKGRVIIIGAGWSGVYMLKHALELGLDAKILEARDHPFGVWHYTRLPGGVLRNTHATSSKYHMSPSDFPFPDDTPDFPHHDIIEKHLHEYLKHFNLEKYISYNSSVRKVSKKNGKWTIALENDEKEESDYLVVATGANQIPSMPDESIYDQFTGEKFHAHYFTEQSDIKDRNILVIGGGETACDIAHILSKENEVHLSIRSGQWFQSTIMGATGPADLFQNRLIAHNGLFRSYINNYFVKETERWWGEGGSGIGAWNPSSKLLSGVYNKSRDVLMDDISKGEIFPRSGVKDIRENNIQFHGDDNTWHEIDTIIFGTGYSYKAGLHFLPEEIIDASNYKLIFYPEDPTIAFVGFARPFVGSIPSVAEAQSRYVAHVFKGDIKLPTAKKMKNVIEKDKKKQGKLFPQDSKRLPFLVDPGCYGDDICSFYNAKPKMFRLLLTNVPLWWKVLVGPISPFHYRLNDPDPGKRNIAINQINIIFQNPSSKKIVDKLISVSVEAMVLIIVLVVLSVQVINSFVL